jgi:hypothetical protein
MAAPPPAPAARPPSAPAPAAPGVGGDVPQFDGDPFAASVAPPAHPAATSAADLGLPGTLAGPPPSPPRRDPGIRLEEPTPPSLRQPFPEPRPFAGPNGGLELEPLAGGAPRPSEGPAPDDPFAGLAATLGDGGLAPPPPPGPPPSFHRPAAVAPPPFARVDRGEADRGTRGVAPASFKAMVRERRSRHRGVLLAVLGALAVAGAVGAWLFIVSRGSTSTTTATVDVDAEPAARPRRPPREEPRPPPEPAAAAAPEPAPPAVPEPAPPAAAPPAAGAPAEKAAREPATRQRAPRQAVAPARPPPQPSPTPAPAEAAGATPAPPTAVTPPPGPAAAPAAGETRKTLQPEDVIAVVRAHRGEFDACIAQAVATGATGTWLGRRVDLLVFVSPSGRVSSAAVDDAEVEPTELGACLRLVARKMVFPAFQGEAVPLALPLRLGKAE